MAFTIFKDLNTAERAPLCFSLNKSSKLQPTKPSMKCSVEQILQLNSLSVHFNSFHSVPRVGIANLPQFLLITCTCDTSSLHGLEEEGSCAAIAFFFVNSVEILTAALRISFFFFLYLIFFVSDAFRTLENSLQYLLRCVLHFNHQFNSQASPLLGSVSSAIMYNG